MKVSILVPIYGVEKYIETCAVSLFEQTYEHIEYIFVDDCSPDRSVAVLQEVVNRYPQRQAQVSIIHHAQNSGIGATRNTALELATGEAVIIVDSDDYMAHDAVEKLVKALRESDSDIVDCAYSKFTGEKVISTTPPSTDDNDTYLRKMLIHNTVSHNLWARIYKRSIFTDHAISTTEGINQGDDYSVIPRLLLHARRTTIPDVLYFYRMNDYGTFSDNLSERHILSYVKANATVARYIRENDTQQRFRFALDLGLLHTATQALNAGMTLKDTDALCGKPTHWIVRAMRPLATRHTLPLLRLAYLVTKRLYLTFFI